MGYFGQRLSMRLRKPGRLVWTCLLLTGAACASPSSTAPAGPSDPERARALLDPATPLPSRPEVVALADAVAVLASKEPSVEEQARLYGLAADLRVRSWRADRAEADAREALELYAAAARTARGLDAACEADRERALLAGELSASATVAYREIYLAKRRHRVAGSSGKESACLAALQKDLARADAFRPTGAELAALEREGDRAEQATVTAAGPSAAPWAAPSASSSAGPPGDLVIVPKDLEPAKGPVKLAKIEKFASEGGGRVVIHLSEPTTFDVGALPADDQAKKDARIYVDIAKGTAKGAPREVEVGGAIKRIRTGPRDDGARVVLDLSAEMHRRVFYLPEPFRIVVDVSSRPPEAKKPQAGGPRVVRRVVIDPGHGGQDDGAVGPTGLKEKDVALDIGKRIGSVLASEVGVDAMLTRNEDVFIPLEERTARANAYHADVFVSIHCNASENGDARGIEVFVLDELKDTNRAAARVAAMENGLGKAKSLDPAALDAEMASISMRLQTGEVAGQSRKLGDLLARATLASLAQRYPDTKDHGLKSAGFYVLLGAEMPAVLFETSFISNPEDEALLAKADYRQKLADGVVNAIRAYREGK
jgi:N-acetylmuramoyl-L-alanine amidase